MSKEIDLKLVRSATVESDQGIKHTFKFQKRDDFQKVTINFEFWGSVPSEWQNILSNDLDIDDKIRVVIGADSRQVKLE